MNKFNLLCLGAACFIAASTASAQTILLDFGPTTVTGGDLTVSPAHAAAVIPPAATTWNQVLLADIGSGILNSTGGATSVSLNLGIETAQGSNIIDFGSDPNGSFLGSSAGASWPLYSGTKVARDGIFDSSVGGAIGLRIDGLASGDYVLYFTGRNNNTASGSPARMFASTGSSSGSFDFSAVSNFANVTNSNTLTNPAGVFVAGTNYNTLAFSITDGNSLFLAIDGTAAPTSRGYLNSIEIVAIPEPSSFVLTGIGLTALLVLRRKRKA